MNTNIKIGFIGFTSRDISKFSKMFQLPRSSKRLYWAKENFAPKQVDMILVNTNLTSADEQYEVFHRDNPTAPKITVGPNASSYHLSGILLATRVLKVLDGVPLAQDNAKNSIKLVDTASVKPAAVTRPVAATSEAMRQTPERPVALTEVAQNSAYQVLIVDDSKMMQKTVQIQLKQLGIDMAIDFADSGEQALQRVENKQYELIFLDVMMPGIDGFETCTIIRKKANMKKTPIIMLTAKQAALDELKGVLAGCSSYLTKPASRSEIYALKLPQLLALSRQSIEQLKLKTPVPTSTAVVNKPEYNVLVVDDSEIMQKALEVQIQRVDDVKMYIDFASSGEEALDRIDEMQYDLVFLDVMMPGIDGFKTCTIMRKKAEMKKTPIIMVTGKTSPLDEVKGVMAGCTTYLTKPLKPENFQAMMKRVSMWLEKYQGENNKSVALRNASN